MNWRAISFDWNQIRAFWATAEEGSLSAAARALSSTQPTIGRQVTALEEELGVTLFERSGRSLIITSAGQDLLEHVKAMGDAASRVSMVASGQSQDVAGKVTITASEFFAVGLLPEILKRLQTEAPGIEIEVVASDRLEDLMRRDADIAIRHVRPDQPDLIARRLTNFTASFYAASDYITANGRPERVDELAGHRFIGPRDTTMMRSYLEALGIMIAPEQFKTTSDNGFVMMEMMRAGLGITVLPDDIWPLGEKVERVLTQVAPINFPVWLVTHRELNTSRRIRIVFDALAAGLSAHGKDAVQVD
ncbi:LysR family transcriptional regulator [Loktanella sp. 1ANDIMAR09]|nr:LysR family transcriptional regulator [Loktanella sp. 1ANDIMAR09]